MRKVFVISSCLALLGCLSHPRPSDGSQRNEIIQIAKREIERRHIRLPLDCDITVDDGVTVFPVGKAREEFVVRFTFTYRGKRDVVYKVVIDRRSRKIDGFIDYRDTIPGGGTRS
jgi:hypothetical protein